ncbi:hypothetical protein BSKO_11521 [Bryopsis sp. KO-2023]|nr:hypothetical protein BSKO_11521 [Bryopsis sp. KO-2023]
MNGAQFHKFRPRFRRCVQHFRCVASRACPVFRLDANPFQGRKKQVHVVWFDPTKCGDVELGVLPPQDVEYVHRAEEKDSRRQRLLARMVLRSTLSGYLNVRPEDIRFRINSHGKPYLDYESMQSTCKIDPDLRNTHFNLTHSKTMIGLAIATGFEVGLDVEERSRIPKCGVMKFAKKKFHPKEVEYLEGLETEGARNNRFLWLWTLKEAFVKSRGVGLYTPPGLRSFGFGFRDRDPSFVSLLGKWRMADMDAMEEYSFAVFHPSLRHLGALCINGDSSVGIPSDVEFWEIEVDKLHNTMSGKPLGVNVVGSGVHCKELLL